MIRLTYAWRCIDCPETGDDDRADKAAERHVKATGHSTVTRGVPA